MKPTELLENFAAAARAQRVALAGLTGAERRARTDRQGQYHLDTVADAAVLPVLHELPVRVLSEETAWSGDTDAAIIVVVDPVDGSTNCARGIPYWGISVCALDEQGPLCAYVENGATGARYTAVRGEGAWLDGERIQASRTTDLDRAVVAIVAMPETEPPWRQFRSLGSAAIALCDVAAGCLDGFLDCSDDIHRPWDYLGGLLVCRESGAHLADAKGRDLVVADAEARRRPVAAGTQELLDALVAVVAR
ncbi:MAG TPA: inositol monophosphatase family protein [Acidimicrobiia bacterium]